MIREEEDSLLPYLCPPGSGVYTVFTGREQRLGLQQTLYGCTDQAAESAWQKTLQTLSVDNRPLCLGICSDSGGGIHRGANWGPLAMREALYAQVPEWFPMELGDVRIIPQLLLDEYVSESLLHTCRQALYGDAEAKRPVSPLSIAYVCAQWIYARYPHRFLLGLGGDHSCAYPLVKAYLEHKKKQSRRAAVIHFDAHTDMMASRLGIPICFGSWVYHVLPDLFTPACWVQVGIRASGRPRHHWESQYGIRQFWAEEIRENGAVAVAEAIISHLEPYGVDELYVTFDIDALDASIASATGTPERDGLSVEEAQTIIKALKAAYPVTGADMMEVAPFIHYTGQKGSRESTLRAAVKILTTLINSE